MDPAMRSPMLVAGGEAVVPAVAEAVAVARERGIFLVWVSFAITNSARPGVISARFLVLVQDQHPLIGRVQRVVLISRWNLFVASRRRS